MELYVVRHGETDYNKEERLMGQRIDAPLNGKGVEQATSLLPQLKNHSFAALYASPLERTKQTAEIIDNVLGLGIQFRDELKERDGGKLSGKTYEEIDEIIAPHHYDGPKYDFTEFGGETSDDVRKRIQHFLDDIETRHKDNEEILVVTHAGIIFMLYDMFKRPVEQGVRNVCVHSF